MDGQRNLERTWKVREKSGNLKINGYGRQSSENLFYSVQKEKDVHSHVVVPCWDCLTETVLIAGHNLFFQNCPCSPFLPCVSLMKYGSFSYEIWYFL